MDPPDLLLVARFDFLHAEIGLSNLTASIEKGSDAIGPNLLHDSVELPCWNTAATSRVKDSRPCQQN